MRVMLPEDRKGRPPAGIDDTTAAAVLQELASRLGRAGYGEFAASCNPLTPGDLRWYALRDCLTPSLKPLVELWLLAESVERQRLSDYMGDLIDPLCDLYLLEVREDGRIATRDLVLFPVLGYWLLHQRPRVNPTLYFGDDSVALMLRLRPRRRGSCLDLCAGPGAQALFCSGFAKTVTAVEVNPVAAGLARLNVLMNDRADVVTVCCGDLYEPVRGLAFDTVVANPPLLPFPEHISYPFVGHGGNDGLKLTWQVLEGLPEALTQRGTAQLIGTCLGDEIAPLCLNSLEQWAREQEMSIVLTVTSQCSLASGSRTFESLVWTAAAGAGLDHQSVGHSYRELLEASGASHLCAYFLHITRERRGGLQLLSVAQDVATQFWYA